MNVSCIANRFYSIYIYNICIERECSVWRKSCSPVGHLFLKKTLRGFLSSKHPKKLSPCWSDKPGWGFFHFHLPFFRWKKNGWGRCKPGGEFDQKMTHTEQKKVKSPKCPPLPLEKKTSALGNHRDFHQKFKPANPPKKNTSTPKKYLPRFSQPRRLDPSLKDHRCTHGSHEIEILVPRVGYPKRP